ncbi:MAG: hypothetical protein ACI4M6_04290 [Christensenellaceae bacterium]
MRKTNVKCVAELMKNAKAAREKGANLKKVFCEIAEKYGMTEKSVRNLYYKTLKLSQNNVEWAILSPKKIVPFKEGEDRILIKEILTRVKEGKSVRQAVYDYAGNDASLALRYQNKYRNIKSKNGALIGDVAKKLSLNDKEFTLIKEKKDFSPYIEVVSKEIDGLYERMKSGYIKRESQLINENRMLKKEIERLRLKIALFKSQFAIDDKNIV